jgi:hypothetical protein
MMYVRDDVVDDLVARDAALQEVVQGRKAMLWRPGQTVGLAVQASLTLGWIGVSLALFWLFTPSVKTFVYFIAGSLLGAAPINWINYRMVRGWPAARSYMYRFATATAALASVSVAVCLLGSNKSATGLAVAGLAFNLLAMRLVAGEKYGLLSATFRAQRKYIGHTSRSAGA